MIVDRDGQGDLCRVLPDDVAVHIGSDLLRGRERIGELQLRGRVGVHLVAQNARTKLHALVADIDVRTCDDAVDLLLTLAAE